MIISHRHKFIYIKTIKTASTSVEAALSRICGPDDVITVTDERLMGYRDEAVKAQNYRLVHPAVPKQKLWRRILGRPIRHYHPQIGYFEHIPAWRVKTYIGDDIWNSYYKFSFERNPWDRQVSFYSYKTRNRDPKPDFDAFNTSKRQAYVWNWELYTIDGKPALDFVGTYENLSADFAKVAKVLGIERELVLPSANASDRPRSYREYYSDHSRHMIAGWYKREIDLFGYVF
jgi:Sulfotransferase family